MPSLKVMIIWMLEVTKIENRTKLKCIQLEKKFESINGQSQYLIFDTCNAPVKMISNQMMITCKLGNW